MYLKVDSAFRDDQTTSQEEYDLTLKIPIKNVLRMRLLSANVPRSMYPVITGFNDQLRVFVDGTGYDIILPEQNYSAAQLAAELQSLIRTASSDTTFLVTFDPQTGRLSFTSPTFSHDVTFATTTPGVARLVGGVDGESYAGAATAVSTLPHLVDLSYPRWLRLIVTCNRVDRGEMWMDENKQFSFMVHFNSAEWSEVQSHQSHETFDQWDKIEDVNVYTLHIKWELPDGPATALDFRGIEHQLVFEV